jgi:CRP-like cAMP-binding protein
MGDRSLSVSHSVLRKKFGTRMTFRNYRDKEAFFSQGDAADSVFYIESGTVKLTAVSTRKRAIIAILSAVLAKPREMIIGDWRFAVQGRNSTAISLAHIRLTTVHSPALLRWKTGL